MTQMMTELDQNGKAVFMPTSYMFKNLQKDQLC